MAGRPPFATRPRGRARVAGTWLAAVAIALAACSPLGLPPSGVPSAPASLAPTTPSDPAPSASGVAVAVDATLLDVLPRDLGGVVLTGDPETAAGIAADPVLAADIDALAVGLYAADANYAVVTVTRLRPGIVSDAYLRGWRDSFDAAVCAQAGGVDGHAEAEFDGRTAYIGTCAGGVRTYHVRLASPDRIISLQALGPARYGELILDGLEE